MRAQLILEVRTEDAALDARRPRHLVDLEHLVELVERDRHDRIGFGRIHSPHHRRSTAVGHHDVPAGGAPVDRRLELGFAARMRDDIRRVGEVEVERTGSIGEVRPLGVERALPDVGRAPACQRSGNHEARCPQRRVLELRNRSGHDRSARSLRELRGELLALLLGRLFAFQAPGPERTPRSVERSACAVSIACRRAAASGPHSACRRDAGGTRSECR